MGKILMIEDDIDLIESMRVIIEKKYEFFYTSEIENAINLIKQVKPDIIILDVMFGEKEKTEGFDLAIKIRQDREISYIPIIMLTAVNIKYKSFGFSPEKDQEYLPVDEFIDKPVQPNVVIEKIEKLLSKKESKWKNWPEKIE